MAKYLWLLAALSTPAFCQTPASGNVAQGILERRLQSLKLLKPSDLRKPSPSKATISLSPNVCAIGLEQAQIDPTQTSRMPVRRPSTQPLDGDVVSTMPACGN